jgi:hypothetical protein
LERARAFREQEEALYKKHGRSQNPGYFIETLQDELLQIGFTNWGWTVYRTCYDNEDEWAIFKAEFERLLLLDMRRYFDEKEVQERGKYLKFPFWEDAAEFGNASTAKLREHFQTYLSSDRPLKDRNVAYPTLEQRSGTIFTSFEAYNFFLVADAASIASVVRARNTTREFSPERMGWINVAEVDWPPRSDVDETDKDDGYEPLVEGLSDYNVGVHRHTIKTLYPQHWQATYNEFDMWYTRPPAVGTEH